MTEIDLVNRALLQLGNKKTISNFGTNRPEEQFAQIEYGPARDELLSLHPWHFCLKRLALALSTETVSGWTYAYSYPADCLQPWDIEPHESYDTPAADESQLLYPQLRPTAKRNRFDVIVASDLNHRLIVCDIQYADAIYSAQVKNPTIYSPLFCAALVYLLALRMGPALAASDKTILRVAQSYSVALLAAQGKDAQTGCNPPAQPNAYVDARGGD